LASAAKGIAGAADERGTESVRPDQQLNQPRIGFRG
jgi:hypothetical protein